MSLFGRNKPHSRGEVRRRPRLGVTGGRKSPTRGESRSREPLPSERPGASYEPQETPFEHNLKTGRMKYDLPPTTPSGDVPPSARSRSTTPVPSSGTSRHKKTKKSSKKRKSVLVIPFWVKGLGVLAFLAFIVLCFYVLLPDVAQEKLSISNINVAAIPEQIRGAVQSALSEELGKENVLYNFSVSETESRMRSRFPQLQNLKLSLSLSQNAEFVLYATGSLREQAAIARNSDAFYLVDPTGFVVDDIPLSRLGEFDLPQVTCVCDFPLAVGRQCESESLKTSLALLSAIRERDTDFYKHIHEVAVVFRSEEETTSIAVLCDGGLEVRLSDINPIDELKKFRTFTEAAENSAKLNPYTEVAYVDMRYRRQLPFMPRSVQRTQMQLPFWVIPVLDKNTTSTATRAKAKEQK